MKINKTVFWSKIDDLLTSLTMAIIIGVLIVILLFILYF
jgi:hypothetical protein